MQLHVATCRCYSAVLTFKSQRLLSVSSTFSSLNHKLQLHIDQHARRRRYHLVVSSTSYTDDIDVNNQCVAFKNERWDLRTASPVAREYRARAHSTTNRWHRCLARAGDDGRCSGRRCFMDLASIISGRDAPGSHIIDIKRALSLSTSTTCRQAGSFTHGRRVTRASAHAIQRGTTHLVSETAQTGYVYRRPCTQIHVISTPSWTRLFLVVVVSLTSQHPLCFTDERGRQKVTRWLLLSYMTILTF